MEKACLVCNIKRRTNVDKNIADICNKCINNSVYDEEVCINTFELSSSDLKKIKYYITSSGMIFYNRDEIINTISTKIGRAHV